MGNEVSAGGSEHAAPLEERPLSDMSEGAIRKAEQSLLNAEGSVRYARKMLSGPEEKHPDPKACASDAIHRIDEALDQLRWERKQRELYTDTDQ